VVGGGTTVNYSRLVAVLLERTGYKHVRYIRSAVGITMSDCLGHLSPYSTKQLLFFVNGNITQLPMA
jgi:hypothetical protein